MRPRGRWPCVSDARAAAVSAVPSAVMLIRVSCQLDFDI
jgi:hypothetical protein